METFSLSRLRTSSRQLRFLFFTFAICFGKISASAHSLCTLQVEELGLATTGSALTVYQGLDWELMDDDQADRILPTKKSALRKKIYQKLKRAFDITLAGASLPIVLPILAAAATAIKLEDPNGSVIFRQERVGKNRRPFTIYKLRTMRSDPKPNNEGSFKTTKNDSRITGVGNVLRLLKLDELPQVFNILKGDMSFVGPRPLVFQEIQQYEQIIPGYSLRHFATPGLTGYSRLASESTVIDDVNPKDAFHIDLYYLHNQGLRFDIAIMFRTFTHIAERAIGEASDRREASKEVIVIISPEIVLQLH